VRGTIAVIPVLGILGLLAFACNRVARPLLATNVAMPHVTASPSRPSPDATSATADPDNFLEVEYKLRGSAYAGSSLPDPLAFGRYWVSDNLPRDVTQPAARAMDGVYLLAEPEVVTEIRGGKGMRVVLVNPTTHTLAFRASDSRLELVQEALDEHGEWRAIESLPRSWCGNSYHRVFLEPDQFFAFPAPRYRGSFETRLRFRLDVRDGAPILSNEFEGSVHPAQFDVDEPYTPNGIMDPYLEVK
jgi:hypothetical protein